MNELGDAVGPQVHENDKPRICGHRWYGPRADVADAYATHVCGLPPNHEEITKETLPPELVAFVTREGKHWCVCGARGE